MVAVVLLPWVLVALLPWELVALLPWVLVTQESRTRVCVIEVCGGGVCGLPVYMCVDGGGGVEQSRCGGCNMCHEPWTPMCHEP